MEAESKADRQNIAQQAAIRATEGIATGISKHVCTDVTNSVLRKVDGNAEMITTADQPATISVLDEPVEILYWQFDFCKQTSANIEVLKAKHTKVKVFGLETRPHDDGECRVCGGA